MKMTPDLLKQSLAENPCAYLERDDGEPSAMAVTCPVRLAMTWIAQPDKKGVYKTCLIIPDGVDIEPLKRAAGDAARAFFGAKLDNADFRAQLKSPFKSRDRMIEKTDGVPKRDENGNTIRMKGFEGEGLFLDAHTKFDLAEEGGLFNRACEPCGATAFYPGAWAIVRLKFAGYDNDGNRGVTAYLSALQFWADDEKLMQEADKSQGFKKHAGAGNTLANSTGNGAAAGSSASIF